MKFVSIGSKVISDVSLKSELKSAVRVGTASFGTSAFFFRKFFKVYYISYDDISGYFKRVFVIPRKTLKGETNLNVENLVILSGEKEVCELRLPGLKATSEAISILKEKLPNIPCEFNREGKNE